jgi:hypothetical protein
MKDKCVMCGCETEYDKDEHIDNRMYYVEGAGQLCHKCFQRIYSEEGYYRKEKIIFKDKK